jgi:hypothetical protein
VRDPAPAQALHCNAARVARFRRNKAVLPEVHGMSKIVNLNRYRKLKARREAAAEAAQNRVRHGRSKAQKEQDAALRHEAERKLEQHRLESGEPDPHSG